MMNKFYITLLMTFCFFSCYADIKQVHNMDEIFQYFKEANSDTLAIFDVDMVLIQPKDPAFQMANMKRFSSICKRIIREIPVEKQMIFLSLMTISTESTLIDLRLPQFLDQLAQKGISLMALTANLTGELGSIKNMENWRVDILRQLNLDFSQRAPYQNKIIFQNLPSYRGNYSTYTNGILFVNGTVCSKGEAFITFLQHADVHPKKIIFIDDREENLKSLEESIKQIKKPIEYHGIHFLGAINYSSEVITEELFEARWKELAEESKKID